MLRIITVLAALFSVTAMACPDLTGAFTCTYSDGSTEVMNIKYRTENGISYYTYGSDEFAADGTVYPLADSDNLKSGTFSAMCSDDITLKNNIKGEYYYQGSDYGPLDMTINYSMDNGNLKQVASGTLKGSAFPDQTATCTKN
jgi:hypothetical protein